MPAFKFVISSGNKSYQIEKDQKDSPVLGKRIGDTFSADFLGLSGYELIITGGSDKDGFPMRKDVEGTLRRRILITKGVGLKTDVGGLRRRRMLRGNTIAADISQINCKVAKQGEKSVEELLGIKKEEKPQEIKTEKKTEEVREEPSEVKEGITEEKSIEAKPEERKELKEERKEGTKPAPGTTEEAKQETQEEEEIKEEVRKETKPDVKEKEAEEKGVEETKGDISA